MDESAERPILAIDLGGTRIRTAYITSQLAVACRRADDTRDEDGLDVVLERISRLASESLAQARATGLPEPVGVGISSPGPLDPWGGVVLAPPNLAGWRNVPLADRVEQALGLPTFLERDTNVAVMAEWRHGAARGAQDVIYITISTGIGGGIIIGGRPLIGRDGTAGEVGHLTVELDGPLCGDGAPGHVEAIASGTAIARDGRQLLLDGRSSGLASLTDDPDAVDARLVGQAADAGDPACQALLARAWTAVGALCSGLVNLLNPEVIVLGGAIALNRPEMLGAIGDELARRAFPTPARRVRVVLSEHGDDVSLVGSLPIVNERLDDRAYRRDRHPTPPRR